MTFADYRSLYGFLESTKFAIGLTGSYALITRSKGSSAPSARGRSVTAAAPARR